MSPLKSLGLTNGRTDIGGLGCFIGIVRDDKAQGPAERALQCANAGALSGDDRACHWPHHRRGRTALGSAGVHGHSPGRPDAVPAKISSWF